MFVGKVRTITRPVTLALLFLKAVYINMKRHQETQR